VRARLGLLCWLLALLALLCGCNVIGIKQRSIERTMRGAGLVAADVKLGADSVHYWAGGHGPTVLLVHGFGASGMWLWYPQVEDLARDHRVIVPDLLWFGESASTDRDFGIDHQVHAVEALLDKLGEGAVDVVGVSYGGLVAHELASERVAQVRHMVIVDSPARAYTREDYGSLCRRFHVDDVAKVLVPHDGAGVEQLLELAYFDPPWIPDFALDQTLLSLYAQNRDERALLLSTVIRDMDILKARPVTRRGPALVIWGRQDPVFPLEIGQRLATSLGAPIRIIDSARHAPNLEHPEAFNRHLRAFLATGG